MKFLQFNVCSLLLLLTLNVAAQKGLDKPYTLWSNGEALKLVSESGWAKQYSSNVAAAAADASNIGRTQRELFNKGVGNPRSVVQLGGNLPIVIRLHSSPVVRKAIVRLQEIEMSYDKMDASEKAEFDKSRDEFLECAVCKDYYVVSITKYLDASGEVTSDGIFQSLTFDDLKDHVTLVNDKGEVRKLAQFTPPNGPADSALFFFKRTRDGKSTLVEETTRDVQFVFTSTFMQKDRRNLGLYPRKFEFPVSKMLVDGKVSF